MLYKTKDNESLARFISDVKLGFCPKKVTSTEGWRGAYKISANKIKCERIFVKNDCFIDAFGNIVVVSYVPAINYFLISNELSECYAEDVHLSYEFSAESQVLRYEISGDVELETYDDFHNCLEKLIDHIGKNIEKTINDFSNGAWHIDNVLCDIEWQVDKIK